MRASVLLVAAILWTALFPLAGRAEAVEGYDAQYSGQSAFLTLAPGVAGTFTVFFLNSGTTTWSRGTSTQVDLASCLADKVTCNTQDTTEAPFNPGTWVSPGRYATTASESVAPGSIATFSYSVKPPLGTVQGIYRFNGDLVIAGTGAKVRAEGYYQDVQVTAAAARIDVAPAADSDEIDIGHTVTITYTSAAGTPTANVPIDVFIVRDASPFDSTGACSRAFGAQPSFSGQKACEIDTADLVTNSAGQIEFSWSGSLEEIHRLVAWTGTIGSIYKSTSSLTQGYATMTWHGRADDLDITPDAKTNRYASATTLTAQLAKDDGSALAVEGLTVMWRVIRGGGDAGSTCTGSTYAELQTGTTDPTGAASLTYTGPADPSSAAGSSTTDCVFAFHDRNGDGLPDGAEPTDAVLVTWSDAAAGTGPTVSLSPASIGLDDSATHTVNVALRDRFGDPIIGMRINLTVNRSRVTTSVKEALGVVLSQTLFADQSGNASYSYTGPGFAATDTIDACADINGDGDCTDVGDVAVSAVTDATAHWTDVPIGSSSTTYRGRVLICDTVNNVLSVYVQAGPQAGNLRFSYNTPTQFFLDNDAAIDETIDGSARTTAVWESKCAVDDPVVILYVPSGTSQFENEGKSP